MKEQGSGPEIFRSLPADVQPATENEADEETPQEVLFHEIGKKEARKVRASGRRKHSVWFGLGMMGIIGWSVAVPTLVGILLGLWMDAHWPAAISWTLVMLVVGLAVGCWTAWYWISKENQAIARDRKGEGVNDANS